MWNRETVIVNRSEAGLAVERLLRSMRTAPYLFVGSGMSRRYLGLETWPDLLRHFTEVLPHPYDFYRSAADGDLPTTAGLIAADFHRRWWTDERFEASRTSHGPRMHSRDSPLKLEVANYLAGHMELPDDLQRKEELELLGSAVVDGVITTNYDELLERVLPSCRVFVGQEDVLFGDVQGIGEIYKIHGSVSAPESLVLTDRDYQRFEARNPYLASKLTAAFIEHPVIFLGYSLSDPNIRLVLSGIVNALPPTSVATLQRQLIFVEWHAGCSCPCLERSTIKSNGFALEVMTLTVANFVELFGVLASLQRKYPARLLRALRAHVHRLIVTNDVGTPTRVAPLDEDSLSVDVVLGVGSVTQMGEDAEMVAGCGPVPDLPPDFVPMDFPLWPAKFVPPGATVEERVNVEAVNGALAAVRFDDDPTLVVVPREDLVVDPPNAALFEEVGRTIAESREVARFAKTSPMTSPRVAGGRRCRHCGSYTRTSFLPPEIVHKWDCQWFDAVNMLGAVPEGHVQARPADNQYRSSEMMTADTDVEEPES